jgi:GNAT superfamily N-acetyltransferase
MGAPFEIRRARLTDAVPIAAVHAASARLAYASIFPSDAAKPSAASLTPGWASTLADAEVFVATESAVISAVVALVQDDMVPAGWRLTRLYVHPNTWGRGIGRSLHDVVLDHAGDRGLKAMNLWVLEANSRARRMYERWGWRLVPGPTLPNDFEQIVDVLYQRSVRAGGSQSRRTISP